jgi:tetratricopeptide (TPR) repeat protein
MNLLQQLRLNLFYFGWLFLCLKVDGNDYSLAERKLLKIVQYEKNFFSLKDDRLGSEEELSRKAQDLVTLYEAYLAENPDDTNALILYGKFLGKVGQSNHAIGFFLKADSINPKIAVVKQQIANYLIENDRPVDALPFLIATVEINPAVADYHFHLGNFLYLFKDQITISKLLGKESAESFAHKCFEKAARQKPTSFDYRLRFAQSFFDHTNSDRHKALHEWRAITEDFNQHLSKPEFDYLKLCQARILLELNQKEKATKLIGQVSSKSLSTSKRVLLESIKQKPREIDPKKVIPSKKTGHLQHLDIDPHIVRLKEVTKKLREENLIKQLHADHIRAHHDSSGQIRLTVTNLK